MFGDGGAFPEIHVAQYPLNMGYIKNQTSNAIQLQVDADGKPKFDAIVKQNVKGSKVSSLILHLSISSFHFLDCVFKFC
jgi:SNW domain-containing protein 1